MLTVNLPKLNRKLQEYLPEIKPLKLYGSNPLITSPEKITLLVASANGLLPLTQRIREKVQKEIRSMLASCNCPLPEELPSNTPVANILTKKIRRKLCNKVDAAYRIDLRKKSNKIKANKALLAALPLTVTAAAAEIHYLKNAFSSSIFFWATTLTLIPLSFLIFFLGIDKILCHMDKDLDMSQYHLLEDLYDTLAYHRICKDSGEILKSEGYSALSDTVYRAITEATDGKEKQITQESEIVLQNKNGQ